MADGMISKGKAMDWAFRILSTLIVPGAIWVGKLEVNNALQEERIRELQADVERNSSINAAVRYFPGGIPDSLRNFFLKTSYATPIACAAS